MEKNSLERYVDHINANILPVIDYAKLHRSYDTDMAYALGILKELHDAMVTVYSGGQLDERDGDEGFVLIPGVVRGRETGKICLALLELDLSSSGEHWGTSFLCKYGVIKQGISRDETDSELIRQKKELGKWIGSYDYCYTASIPGDIHVQNARLPDALKNVLKDFRELAAAGEKPSAMDRLNKARADTKKKDAPQKDTPPKDRGPEI